MPTPNTCLPIRKSLQKKALCIGRHILKFQRSLSVTNCTQMHQWSDIRNVQWWGWPIFNPALLSYLLTVLVLPCTLRFCHCQRSSEQGASESYTADCTSTLSSAAEVSVSQTQVCQLSHWFGDTWQLTGLLGSDLSQNVCWQLESVIKIPTQSYWLCASCT